MFLNFSGDDVLVGFQILVHKLVPRLNDGMVRFARSFRKDN